MSRKKSDLQKVLSFAKLLNQFRQVVRILYANGEKRYENDVEHSYMLTMLADYILSIEKSKLDRNKVRAYCLVHDLVEAYAGDTYIYSKNAKHLASKHVREAKALKKLIKNFPEYKEMWRVAEEFEKREDDESKFVYALDKVQPVLQIYLDGGRTWRKEKIVLKQLTDNKDEKVKISPIANKYWIALISILKKNEKKLFPK